MCAVTKNDVISNDNNSVISDSDRVKEKEAEEFAAYSDAAGMKEKEVFGVDNEARTMNAENAAANAGEAATGKKAKTPIDYKAAMESRNKRNLFACHIGLAITEMREGYAVTEMKIQPYFRNPIGSIHGGCLFSAADSACGAAASSFGTAVTTLDSSFHYLRAGMEDSTEIKAIASVVKKGKKISVVDVDVEDQKGKLLAHGIFTYSVVKKAKW